MTELWVTSIVVGAWVLAAGLVVVVGSFLVQRLGDRRLAMWVAKERFGPGGVERAVTAEPGVVPVSNPAWVLVRASEPAFADREMAHTTSTAA